MTSSWVCCRSCGLYLGSASKLTILVKVGEGKSWLVGPLCAPCCEYAVERRSSPMTVEHTDRYGALTVTYYPLRGTT